VYQPASSRIIPQPKGVVLIISPWNYPFQLLITPLIGSIAAGNCALLKPSELAPATSAVLAKLVERTFSPEYCALVEGGVEETTALLRESFDHIFFTGSIPVGKIVMRAAAEHLTPVTLELGGKSPCIIDKETDIKVTARRIAWGKFFNCGQTCVAPDYLLVPTQIKREVLAALKQSVQHFFGNDPQTSPDYGRIINERHFDRLVSLISGEVLLGGTYDRSQRYIPPTVIDRVSMSDKVMEDEIFGPILPVLEYDTLDEAFALVRQRPNPLACYIFTTRRETEHRVLNELSFGGGCVNDTLIHVGNAHLPFGGIGASGMGAYHGQTSFDVFSHFKSVMKSPQMIDLPLKYPPYGKRLNLVRKMMR
jgi:acyl-CoA reductase-like NAD-dependent aldehyde dehydrogenase